jgi:cell division protein ZapA
MPQVNVTIHNRPYQIACEDGEEAHDRKLADYIDRRVTDLAQKSGVPGPAGQITEARLLVMASLLIADELGDAYDDLEELRKAPPKTVPDPATVKMAEEARGAASAAKAQLAEAETATRNAIARAAEADNAKRAAEAEAETARKALADLTARIGTMEQNQRAIETHATQAEAALQSASAKIMELEEAVRGAEAEKASIRAVIASLSLQNQTAHAEEERVADGIDSLAVRIETIADRLERATAR